MGLLSWFFPTPEQRIANARHALEAGRWRDARDEVEGIEGAEALAIRGRACNELVRLNLEAALDYARAGDEAQVVDRMALAEALHAGGLEADLRAARKQIREIREERKQQAQRDASAAVRVDDDPLGLVGRGLLREASREAELSSDDHEVAARSALIVENYPKDLRDGAARLGRPFLDAVLAYEDGRPDLALQGLLALGDDEPLVMYERARCAVTLNDPAAAARAFRRFAELAGGHRAVGNEHSAVSLSLLLARSRDLGGALAVLRDLRLTSPGTGGVLHAQVLVGQFKSAQSPDTTLLAEAEDVLREVIARTGKNADIYALLADVRLLGGHRVPAMSALEMSIAACCDNPAKCGYKAPDPTIQRSLATLYLEDGIETERALGLATQALAKVEQPAWEDLYLDALAARARGDVEAREAIAELWATTPVDDPHRERLERHLPEIAHVG